ncbi:MAG: hypothetical protein ABFC96_12925, partial [Thermoguttaceae bacterium]
PRGEWSPLSKLDWPLNSTWGGLRVGVKKPTWDAHVEWLTPVSRSISGSMEDRDWGICPPYNGDTLDSLSASPSRWSDGQKLEVEEEVLWTDHFLGLPVEFWPLAGFRWQRFDMMAYDGTQIIANPGGGLPPVGYRWNEDTISFNQQYYMAYLGGQLRKSFARCNARPITITLQADYGAVAGYNVDHHISGYEADGVHRYTMESTGGDVLHVALIADVPFGCHVSVGVQADDIQICTTGTHRMESSNATSMYTESWDTGVVAQSEQRSVTAYVRCCW